MLWACALLVDAREVRLRPSEWAQPLIDGALENAYRVDARLYRSAQPSTAAAADLRALGVRRVLNLRDHHDDDHLIERGLAEIRVQMEADDITAAQLEVALGAILARPEPILVHCWHGADRTGCVVAAYRMVVQGWSAAAAIDELRHGGYGYHVLFDNIPVLLQGLDVVGMRRRLGLAAGSFEHSVEE